MINRQAHKTHARTVRQEVTAHIRHTRRHARTSCALPQTQKKRDSEHNKQCRKSIIERSLSHKLRDDTRNQPRRDRGKGRPYTRTRARHFTLAGVNLRPACRTETIRLAIDSLRSCTSGRDKTHTPHSDTLSSHSSASGRDYTIRDS